MKKTVIALKSTKLFASFGYFSIVLQWLWLIVTLGVPLITETKMLDALTPNTSSPVVPTVSNFELPGFAQIIVVAASLIFAISVSLYVAYAMPRTVGRTGKNITQKSAKNITAQLSKKHKLSKKSKKQLFERVTWTIKIATITLPLLALLIPTSQSIGLSHFQIVVVGLYLGSWSILWFGLQFVVMKLAHLDSAKVW